MKFGAVVGNPPYQVVKGVDTGFASALYPSFIDLATSINPTYVSLIVPSRWMTKTGQGISDIWVDKMLSCNHFMVLRDFHDASDCFENVEIKGGVCYFLYKNNYTGKCVYSIKANNIIKSNFDYLNSTGAGVIIRDVVALNLVNKIKQKEGEYYNCENFSKLVGPVHLFDKDGVLGTKWQGFKIDSSNEYDIKYYLNKRLVASGAAWIKRADIPKGLDSLPLHKVYISEAYGAGDTFPHQILGVPFYGEQNSVCSETYLCIGYNEIDNKLTEEQCRNIVSYIKTMFFRFMVYVKKKTQHAPASVYQFVPLQDFTSSSDIDWSASISDIDRQLYRKYGLSADEVAFIEKMIKPME